MSMRFSGSPGFSPAPVSRSDALNPAVPANIDPVNARAGERADRIVDAGEADRGEPGGVALLRRVDRKREADCGRRLALFVRTGSANSDCESGSCVVVRSIEDAPGRGFCGPAIARPGITGDAAIGGDWTVGEGALMASSWGCMSLVSGNGCFCYVWALLASKMEFAAPKFLKAWVLGRFGAAHGKLAGV